MPTFICQEYPTMTVHLPALGRDIRCAHGEYTARDEEEAEAIRAVIAAGHFPAYEEDREASAARAVLAEKTRKAVEKAERQRQAAEARNARRAADDDEDED